MVRWITYIISYDFVGDLPVCKVLVVSHYPRVNIVVVEHQAFVDDFPGVSPLVFHIYGSLP